MLSIHVLLPDFARVNREILQRFAKTPAKDTLLQFSTLNMFGVPKTTMVPLSQLHICRPGLNGGNLAWNRSVKDIPPAPRKWWEGKDLRSFGVSQQGTTSKSVKHAGVPEVWEMWIANLRSQRVAATNR